MILDALLNFVPIGTNLSIVGGAAVPSNVIDLLGTGSGTAPRNIIGNATLFGEDSGLGMNKPQVQCAVGTAFVTANGATLNAAFQAAPDTGVGSGYVPGAWQTLVETGPLTVAQLAAQTIFGRFDWPPVFPITLRPRYLRLLFTPLAGSTFTAGTVAYAIVTMVRDDYAEKNQPANYTLAHG